MSYEKLNGIKISRALISVSDKSYLENLAKYLSDSNIEILSTGGTAEFLKNNKIPVTQVSDYTGSSEVFDGRVKTLHPKIAGEILFDRFKEAHLKEAEKYNIKPIDLVVVNLYPFEKTIKKKNVTLDEAIENIDIGGHTLIRESAKNFKYVAIVVDPGRYNEIISEMYNKDNKLSLFTRFILAKEAFEHIKQYDEAIYNYFKGSNLLDKIYA